MNTKAWDRCALAAFLSAATWFAYSDSARASDAEPTGAAKAIQKPMALSFDRNPFDATMRIVSDEIGVPIEFIGSDLQAEGITKNQQFGLDEPEQPADELLRKILKKVSPEDKLVYIIKRKDGVETIFITTRFGVERRKEKLPPEFELPKTTAKPAAKTPAKAPPKRK